MKQKVKPWVGVCFCLSSLITFPISSALSQELEHSKVSEGALFEGWLTTEKNAVEKTIARDIRHVRAALSDEKIPVVSKGASLKTAAVPTPQKDEEAVKDIPGDKGSAQGYIAYCKDGIKKDFKSGAKSGAVMIAPIGALAGGVVGSGVGGPLGAVGGAVAGGAAGAVVGGAVFGGMYAITAGGMCAYDYLETR